MLRIVVIVFVLTLAGFAEHSWHRACCLCAIRNAQLVVIGLHEYGLAEYSYRHVLPDAPLLPDPRDVQNYMGPVGQFRLSGMIVWFGAFCTAAVCAAWPYRGTVRCRSAL